MNTEFRVWGTGDFNCVMDTDLKTKKKSSIERIFRNRKETEPKNYFNNRIKAINKLND